MALGRTPSITSVRKERAKTNVHRSPEEAGWSIGAEVDGSSAGKKNAETCLDCRSQIAQEMKQASLEQSFDGHEQRLQ